MHFIDDTLMKHWAQQPRRREADKSAFGHVLILGGDLGMWGAVHLAATAALKMGAGLVSVLTHEAHAPFVSLNCPELMSAPFQNESIRNSMVKRATHMVIGPGLMPHSAFSAEIFSFALAQTIPILIDAGALHLLAKQEKTSLNHVILTPHPGEAAALLHTDVATVQQDRMAACQKLIEMYQAVVVLKGAGTLVGQPNAMPQSCPWGNPYMASAGMGDALSGLIAGCMAQAVPLYESALMGVALHAKAGDLLMRRGPHGFLASDVIEAAVECLNAYHTSH